MAISRQKEARSRDYTLLLSNDFKGSLSFIVNSTIDNLHTPGLGTVWITVSMHNLDDTHPTRLGFETSTSEFRATTEPNEPSGPANIFFCQQLTSLGECVLIKQLIDRNMPL